VKFTPRLSESSNKRADMDLSEADYAKIGRGTWEAQVTDQRTGRSYLVRGADCGLGCHCDAVIEREIKPVLH
jgi:hypothetical protein